MKLLFILLGNVFLTCMSTSAIPVKIICKLNNLPAGKVFMLTRITELNRMDTVKVVVSKINEVVFEFDAASLGQTYFIQSELDSVEKTRMKRNWMRFFFDDAPVYEVFGDYLSWPYVELRNSPATKIYDLYHKYIKTKRSVYDSLVKLNPDAYEVKDIEKQIRDYTLSYFNRNINSPVVPLLVLENRLISNDEKEMLLSGMPEIIQNSFQGKRLKKGIRTARLKEKVSIGKKIPSFKVRREDGRMVAVDVIARENKYTLLDFWASWCAPCREEIPNVKRVYNEFKQQGFNVIGISIDKDTTAWKKALKELRMKWINTIDSELLTEGVFSIKAIPGYILVNSNAEIVAVEIVGYLDASWEIEKVKSENEIEYSLTGEGLKNTIDALLKAKK